MEEKLRSLSYFTQSNDKIKTIEKLSGGHQNLNYKVTTVNNKKFVCRIPGIDANEHGQIQTIVYNNSKFAYSQLKIAPNPCYFEESSGIMVTEYVDGVALSVSQLRETPELLDQVINVIRSYHNVIDSNNSFLSSKASDNLFGYDVSLLEGRCTNTELEKTKNLQSLLKCSLGKFDALVSCHNDLIPANVMKASNGKTNLIFVKIFFVCLNVQGVKYQMAIL